MITAHEALRRLAIGEPTMVATVTDMALTDGVPASDASRTLDDRTRALVQVAALIAVDAQQSSYGPVVQAAQRAGVGLDEMVAVIAAISRTVGSARVVAAAPRLALAAGYDIDADLE